MATANYKVWWPDRGHKQDDARTVLAVDHRHAATIWADWYDAYSADYAIVGGEVAEVQVLREDENQPTKVKVRGFETRTYSSDEG